ncbi:YchJ family protein [Dyadobacter sp. CY345]|uniref:YchJ family protein n=1 Tax=Dyadobacter sp. CY345 TaxID=2909335 RepID=UPI001F2044BF|nr:YchJ family protein [Dyadobacter sp. CY345]MCF2443742.1 YchJ family protein [Dyadobacter sp. CY345]
MKTCFCGSDQPYSRCCGPIIKGTANAASAEKLMRSRYSAYVMAEVDYLFDTTHVSKRAALSKKDIRQWAKSNNWQKLEIIAADTFTVEFNAYFKDKSGKQQIHHEKSTFAFENGSWYYLDGIFNEDI